MRVLGNLHIDAAVAAPLTPLGAGQAPCIRKRLFSPHHPSPKAHPGQRLTFGPGWPQPTLRKPRHRGALQREPSETGNHDHSRAQARSRGIEGSPQGRKQRTRERPTSPEGDAAPRPAIKPAPRKQKLPSTKSTTLKLKFSRRRRRQNFRMTHPRGRGQPRKDPPRKCKNSSYRRSLDAGPMLNISVLPFNKKNAVK